MHSSPKSVSVTRRQFVLAGALGSVAAAVGCSPGSQSEWEFLSPVEARALTVLCDQIVPADDFPSASQAGALHYIDRQLVRHYQRHQDIYRQGLERADAASRRRFGSVLAETTPAQQLQMATEIEQQDRAFFELVRTHTLEGYYGSPRHGGNRDAVSWRMLGLADPPMLGRAQYDLRKDSHS